MKSGDDLLSSFDRSWKEFSEAWKKARSKTSEKSIHDLRVKTRRFIAVLELANALPGQDGVAGLQRRLKKVLKRMGPLRDLQVQLENVSQIPQAAAISDFKNRLERRERQEIKRIPDELKRGTKLRLAKNVKHVLSGLDDAGRPENGRILHSVERVIAARRNEFLRAERRFQREQPVNEEALHDMRIALKKMRYVVEAASPVLGPSAKQRARQMRMFQKLMGDSRDLEMLRAELEKWAKKKGRKIAIVPALERLEEKRQGLIRKIVTSAPRFDKLFGTERAKPVAETTRAVDARVPASTSSRPESGERPAPRLKR
ncbi:MAG TPA: CHAD domain-containing protein [Terriglobia bacterium]|jgi:CHAD domain-containing protein